MPAFEDIEQEAKKVSEDAWEAFMTSPGTGDEDPSQFAEAAEEAGISHYLLLSGIRQGMVNLFAAGIYHVFEQQVMLFLRRQVLHPTEEDDPNLFSLAEFRDRLMREGLDIASLPSWTKVAELRLLANTVKHAEGRSAQDLHKIRPDLFQSQGLDGFFAPASSAHVIQPLAGEDLYVSLDDLREYCAVLIKFWEELGHAIQEIA